MKKALLLIIALLILVAAVFYFGLHTYFTGTEIKEALPASMEESYPNVIRTGSFVNADFVHRGSGTASIMEVDEGMTILRLEKFSVTNGPDLYVYLTKSDSPTGDLESLGDFLDLGPLKAAMGDQNYAVRGDIEGYTTAVIWCRKYGVLFSYAVMQ
ncbi:MAG: hypothetical protein A3C88_02975 [Candidatus Yanofskybacteria bacterium RIFCSPHIGHO2_02_FULL_50_12]|uniref:DM13 domain-containing protein n=1 Tax=Candidatus Yanofskybacteria bacterium RIFCSPHIGHO2_02_FULL_50_12 TaxID=1802685 RepID=A0A1F8FU63_9BACT|nr:MAG: hypothetical protein A3C88_02975 [Candidatus Yanofskybacteria bacterium RIFCSPHIGHO2_02_FULL_50_12]